MPRPPDDSQLPQQSPCSTKASSNVSYPDSAPRSHPGNDLMTARLSKISPIRIRLKSEGSDSECSHGEIIRNGGGGDDDDDDGSMVEAKALDLDRIRTTSAPSPSPRRFSSSSIATDIQANLAPAPTTHEEARASDHGLRSRPKLNIPLQHITSLEQGKKVHWSQSKSLRLALPSLNASLEGNHAAYAKEMQSPRFQAILRVTSGRRKKAPEIKSFSHELNSKGVRPLPFWKSRAFGRMEEIMVMVRAKFDKLKEEVNSDLGTFAGDLVGILERNSDSHPEWKECLEDLLLIARKCAKMSPGEFWLKCEGIVQALDDRRQELPMGTLKQVHTRLLFILTRCTRLVQFQKESAYEDEHLAASQQLSDLGVYPEQAGATKQELHAWVAKQSGEPQNKKAQGQDQSHLTIKLDKISGMETLEVGTAKSGASTPGSYRMSSWKKLPSAAEKNRKGTDSVDTPTTDKPDLHLKDETAVVGDPLEHSETVKVRRVTWGVWGDQQNVMYENSLICRICEVEIPTVHVEEHSRICTIADRCDLKGLTVNERLERVAETLERILESWTLKSADNVAGGPEVARMSTYSMPEECGELSPKQNSLSLQCSEDALDCVPEADDGFVTDDLNLLPEMSSETNGSKKGSSPGSLTPRSPLLTPWTSQIELLLSRRNSIFEHESHQQISKLLDIARSVANINTNDYTALEYMLDRLDDLKYAIQDRKVDALVLETFGRRIEKLLQEKYVLLCGQIDDDKLEAANTMADEESSVEEEAVRSLRASPINPSTKDRTTIEDFEIIKPISRGAFGRVFLARKRATGDFFAIKVLKKADMIRKNAVESILAERNILISVRNPFVVRFFYSFTCRENLYLVMEYLNGGDLFSLLRNLGCLEEDMARVYIAELVLALEYLHSLSVIHRDLKPDNLLIGPDGHIKLTDFGLSNVGLINSTDDLSGPSVRDTATLGDSETKPTTNSSMKREQRQKHAVVGTPDYLAPEILLGMGHGATADWWSVGVILFELLVGIPPFNAEHAQQIFDNIMNRDIPWPKIPEEMSSEAYDLIDKLLIENPVTRLGATGAGEVKRHPFFGGINWDTLARQKATFIPAAEAHDTSYFMSRYIWNPVDENVHGGSDFDDLTETGSACSSSTYSNMHDEDDDECANLAEFSAPTLDVKYSFSNFSFKNLSQLASINYDLVVKSAKESMEASKQSIP